MADPLLLDHLDAEILATSQHILTGPDAHVRAWPGITLTPHVPPHEVDEIHLEDITLTLHAARTTVVVGLGAVVYVTAGASVARVVDGGTVHLAPGAHVDDIDEPALARGDITITHDTAPAAHPHRQPAATGLVWGATA